MHLVGLRDKIYQINYLSIKFVILDKTYDNHSQITIKLKLLRRRVETETLSVVVAY